MNRADPAVYPGAYVTCVFDHTKALCRRGGHDNDPSRPGPTTCRPLDCRNVALTADNVASWDAELQRIQTRLAGRPPLPPLLHRQLADRRDHLTAFLTTQQHRAP
jgi:hypothetical protein